MLSVLAAPTLSAEEDISGEQALQLLLEGNSRFISGDLTQNEQNMTERRSEIVSAQKPFAVILGCSDSRVPPEIIFDQGLGDIFVVRTAGHVLDNVSIESIEYAVDHLHVPLVIVLGHDGCGAVTSVVEGGEGPCHLPCLVEAIQPAVDEAMKMGNESQLLEYSIDNNIKNIKEKLNESELIKSEEEMGKLMIVGARYRLNTGVVEIID